MSSVEKLVAKLALIKGPVAVRDLERILAHYGYARTRVAGSHMHYRRSVDGPTINFPAHNGKVKHYYVQDIIKTITSLS